MTASNQFTPLTLDLIEEGEFRDAIDKAIQVAQHDLASHVAHWGERAGKAKAEVCATIKMECSSSEDGVYSVEASLKIKAPSRPTRVTAAFSSQLSGGHLGLFVRGTGSTQGDPKQMHLPIPGGPIDVSIDTQKES